MQLTRVDEFENEGRRFTLYEGGSFVLFEEHEDYSEGIGTIERAGAAFTVIAWWRPGPAIVEQTLTEAVGRLLAIKAPLHAAATSMSRKSG